MMKPYRILSMDPARFMCAESRATVIPPRGAGTEVPNDRIPASDHHNAIKSRVGSFLNFRKEIMMKHLAAALSLFLFCGLVVAQHHSAHSAPRPVALVTGYGDWHHSVTTGSAQAQKFFDQGLRYIYAFNHEEAARSFGRAAELDPKMAMAYWGTAESIGPNYNDPADPERFKQAHEAIQKASDLAAGGSGSGTGQ